MNTERNMGQPVYTSDAESLLIEETFVCQRSQNLKMSKVTMFSSNDEEFSSDSAGDLVDGWDLNVGDKYYSCEFVKLDANWILDGRQGMFFEWLSESLQDEIPEHCEIEYNETPAGSLL